MARQDTAAGVVARLACIAEGLACRLTFFAVLVFASIAAVSAQAQSTWNATGTGAWNATGNWSTNSVPTTTAIFGTSSQTNVTFPPSAPPIQTFQIQTIQINTGSSSYSFNLSGNTLDLNSAGGGIVDNSASQINFSNGTIAGSGGIEQLGSGTLILNATGTHTGATTVDAGTLQVNGSIASAVTVNSGVNPGAMLSGTGAVGTTAIGRGTLEPGTPGNPTGTLTINGSLALSSVAGYVVDVNGTNASTTNVNGAAALSGIVTAVAAPGSAASYSAADTYTILNATGGVSRTFFGLGVSGSFGNLVPYLAYNTNNANNNVVMGLTGGTAWLGATETSGVGYQWATTTNWAGGTVPTYNVTNAPATTVATFGGTPPPATTPVAITAVASANTLLIASSAAASFPFTINGGGSLTLAGVGIVNNSSYPPQFDVGGSAGGGILQFQIAATASNAVINNYSGGSTVFGTSAFTDTATAGTTTINNNGGTTTFNAYTTAGSANITNSNAGTTTFNDNSTAGAATIVTDNGSTTTFNNNSTGGNAVFIVNTGGIVDFAASGGPLSNPGNVTAGAIEETDGGTCGTTCGAIQLGGNTLMITAGVSAPGFAGVISGSGGLTIAGGTTTLSGTNTYTGATTINGGTLAVTGSIATSSAVTVNSGGTLSGTGAVPGVTVTSGGTLAPGASDAGTLIVDGSLKLNSGADYAASISSTNGASTATSVTGGSNTATLGGTFTAVAGTGTYVPGNLYTVLTTAAASGVTGTFSGLGVTGNFGNQVPYLIYSSNKVQVELTAGNIWSGGTSNWNTPGNWSLGVPTAALNSQASTATFNGAGGPVTVNTAATAANMLFTSGAPAYSFTINGGNSLALSGIGVVDNSSHAPTFNVEGASAGTFTFQDAATAGDAVIATGTGGLTEFLNNSTGGTAQFTTTGTGVVDFSGTTGPAANGTITAGSIAGTGGSYYLGTNTLTVGNSSSQVFSGVISSCGTNGTACEASILNSGATISGGSLIKVGSGTLTLGGVNTYTGATTIDAGTLALSSSGSIANSSEVAIATGGTFDISGTTSGTLITTLADSAAGQAGTVNVGTQTLTISNGSSTFSGAITGTTGGLTVSGGVQTLAGVSSYSGATTITGGTLNLTGTNSIAAASAVTIDAGGTLGLGENAQTITAINLNGGTIEGGLLAGTIASSGGTINGVGGSAAVNAQSGITTLSGTNTYTGATTVSSGATLDLGSVSQTIAVLNGAAGSTVTNATNPTKLTGSASPVLTIDNGGTFAGVIANGTPSGVTTTTGVNVTGGTLTLSGANTYTGATTIGSNTTTTATLALSGAGSIADLSGVAVKFGGVLSGTGTASAVTVNAGGVLAPGTVGTPLTISGNLTLASGADYAVAVTNASGNTSWAAVTGTGTATLASVLSIAAGAGVYSASDTYTVLSTTAANGVNGTFSGINIASGSFGNFVPYLTYNANSVVMDLTAGNTWNGTTSTWNTTTNWSTGIVPTANAILPQNTVATFSNNSASPTVSVNTAATVATLLFASTSTQAYTFNIAGGNSLTLSGTGIDDNSGNPALAPKFNVGGSSNGTLAFQGAATAGDAIITTNSGGLTEFSGNSTGGTAQFNTTGNGVVDFSGSTGPAADGSITADSIAGLGNYYLGNSTLVLEGPQSTTVSGVISDCGSGNQCKGSANGTTGGALVMVGAGTLTLSGANTYSGGTTLSAGTVNVGVNSVFITAGVPSSGIVSSAIGTGPLSFNGGTLQAGGAYTIANAAQISVASPGDLGGIIDAHGNTFTLAGNIADDPAGPGGTLTITSTGAAGTVVFSGMNSYSGATTINSGATLAGGAANALSANSAVTDNGTLDLGSVNQTIGSLSGSGTVTNLSNPTLPHRHRCTRPDNHRRHRHVFRHD